jgi:2-C-methyl-D-erythritol 4-phosphate cytidylyltransferase / 2-C-methyl-D-erythritol 2,4-cyclodiphosphate synthase
LCTFDIAYFITTSPKVRKCSLHGLCSLSAIRRHYCLCRELVYDEHDWIGADYLVDSSTIRDIAVVVVAAGRGERAGAFADGPKQYQLIGGQSIISRTISTLLADQRFSRIVAVIHPDDEELFRKSFAAKDPKVTVVHGGPSRQSSTYLGLLGLKDTEPDYVMIHDAVRPFLSTPLLDRIIEALSPNIGVVPALPVSDTIKKVDARGMVHDTISRTGLYSAQTPQAFAYNAILSAHAHAAEQAETSFTDDASIAEYAGLPVCVVEGDTQNVKLTWRRDIEMADMMLSERLPDVRVGNGYDVHAFEPGDQVILCGVSIPHIAKLSGHSDADVALHALTDALLATQGAGDIGTHFPPSDKKWKGASSRIFVEHAVRLIAAAGGRIANADITLICEAPKISAHRESMVTSLSSMLGIDSARISVKATTNEKLGFIGRGEGIAAIATASVVYPGNLK